MLTSMHIHICRLVEGAQVYFCKARLIITCCTNHKRQTYTSKTVHGGVLFDVDKDLEIGLGVVYCCGKIVISRNVVESIPSRLRTLRCIAGWLMAWTWRDAHPWLGWHKKAIRVLHRTTWSMKQR